MGWYEDWQKSREEKADFDKRITELFAELKRNDKYTSWVYLSEQKLSNDDFKTLLSHLKKNTHVTSLDLANAEITDKRASLIADMLKANRKINTINLSRNKIGDDGAKALADALKNNPVIKEIDLSGNKICNNGANALIEMLKNNKTIRFMDLDYSNMSQENEDKIHELLQRNKGLATQSLASVSEKSSKIFNMFVNASSLVISNTAKITRYAASWLWSTVKEIKINTERTADLKPESKKVLVPAMGNNNQYMQAVSTSSSAVIHQPQQSSFSITIQSSLNWGANLIGLGGANSLSQQDLHALIEEVEDLKRNGVSGEVVNNVQQMISEILARIGKMDSILYDTAQEVGTDPQSQMEKGTILSNQELISYYLTTRKELYQAIAAATVIGSGFIQKEDSFEVGVIKGLLNAGKALPGVGLICGILEFATGVVADIKKGRQLARLAALEVDGTRQAKLIEEFARKLTLAKLHNIIDPQIEQLSGLNKLKYTVKKVKDKAQEKWRYINSGIELNAAELMAVYDVATVLEFIMNNKLKEKEPIIPQLIECVMGRNFSQSSSSSIKMTEHAIKQQMTTTTTCLSSLSSSTSVGIVMRRKATSLMDPSVSSVSPEELLRLENKVEEQVSIIKQLSKEVQETHKVVKEVKPVADLLGAESVGQEQQQIKINSNGNIGDNTKHLIATARHGRAIDNHGAAINDHGVKIENLQEESQSFNERLGKVESTVSKLQKHNKKCCRIM